MKFYNAHDSSMKLRINHAQPDILLMSGAAPSEL